MSTLDATGMAGCTLIFFGVSVRVPNNFLHIITNTQFTAWHTSLSLTNKHFVENSSVWLGCQNHQGKTWSSHFQTYPSFKWREMASCRSKLRKRMQIHLCQPWICQAEGVFFSPDRQKSRSHFAWKSPLWECLGSVLQTMNLWSQLLFITRNQECVQRIVKYIHRWLSHA